jgi:hypothetical protein
MRIQYDAALTSTADRHSGGKGHAQAPMPMI